MVLSCCRQVANGAHAAGAEALIVRDQVAAEVDDADAASQIQLLLQLNVADIAVGC